MKHKIVETHEHPKYPRLTLQLRNISRFYQARTFLDGRLLYHSTKTDRLTTALKLGGERYVSLVREHEAYARQHPVKTLNPTMAEAFVSYRSNLETTEQTEYADQKWSPIRGFWGTRYAREITPADFHDFYAWRRTRGRTGRGVGNHTLHKDTTLIRQILKYAAEKQILTSLPVIPSAGKVAHNPRKWLNHTEWKHLLKVSKRRIAAAKRNKRLLAQRNDCHDFMVFMVHSMMRVEEVRHLTFGDCRVVRNTKGSEVLVCDVRQSKTGPRPNVVCLVGAAGVYKRRKGDHAPSDLIFPRTTTAAFRELLSAANLYQDGDGNTRNLKSLRATGISFRVLDGSADIALIAKNSGTSIQSINDFYAKYLRGTDDIDALTNVQRKPRREKSTKKGKRTPSERQTR